MFEGLRKKLSDAVNVFAKREEKEIQEKRVEVKEEKVEKLVEEPKKLEKVGEKPVELPMKVEKIEEKQTEKQKPPEIKKQEKKDAVKISLTTKIKSVLVSTVHLSDNEIDDFLENIRISMLESDVSYETTEAFLENLRTNLKTARIDAKNINKDLIEQVRKSLFDVLARSGTGVEIENFIKEKVNSGNTPVKILFLGPNGTGKTTTIAKLAYKFKKAGISSVLSASDTFRAAAIEQTEHHANKVGVPVIKSKYGADPASIAFDAIGYARSHSIQAVLIDSAGRQETNKNLINEMQKMVRVAKPDLIVFVGESIAGNQLSEQVKEFNKFIKIDGIILTKLDTDAKGGNAISIAYTTGIPILFIGTGESYEALLQYTPSFIVDSIMPNN